MKLSIYQENLSAALGIVSRAVSTRSTMPILGNVLLYATGDKLRIAATNREIGITAWIGARVDADGATTIPARLLTDFISALPTAPVTMERNAKTETLRLACDSYTANMRGLPADEFPLIQSATDSAFAKTSPIDIDAAQLMTLIDRVAFAASTDENRAKLTGVKVTVSPEALKMAATDGFRLSVASVPIDGENGACSAIVPAKSIVEVARVAKDAETCQMHVSNDRVLFVFTGGNTAKWQRVEIVAELIAAKFPDYQQVIPQSATTTATVNVKELQQAIRIAMLYAKGEANIIRLSVGDGAIVVSGQNAETGDTVSRVDCEVTGDGLDIAMSGKYLMDALPQFDDLVEIEFTNVNRPALFHGGSKDEFLHVVMPMQSPRGE